MPFSSSLTEAMLPDPTSRNIETSSKDSNCSQQQIRADGEVLDLKAAKPILVETLDGTLSSGSLVVSEVKSSCSLAWPLVLFNVGGFAISTITLMFVGHLGELELSSASIATSFANVTWFTVMLGLASTLETLCGQAYGAKMYHLLGVYLQSAWIVSVAAGLPMLILWMNVEVVFKALGQDPEIARMAGRYLKWLTPGIFGAAIIQPLVKFMQTQSVVIPLMLFTLLAVVFHIGNCHVLMNILGLGFEGGALSITVSYSFLLLLVCVYTWSSSRFKDTWTGFSWEAIRCVTLYTRLAIPSTIMFCLECWALEFLLLASGLMPNPQLQLSLLSIGLTTTNLAFMIPTGLSAAVSTRVSNELGAYRAGEAQLAGMVVLGLSVLSACIIACSMILARNVWGKAFSGVNEIVQSVADLMPLIALSALTDGIQGVLSGIARGCGRQDAGAYINLTAFYIFGIPAGLFLGFSLKLYAWGVWMGHLVGQSVQVLLLIVLILTTNWEKMANEALKRVGAEPLIPNSLRS